MLKRDEPVELAGFANAKPLEASGAVGAGWLNNPAVAGPAAGLSLGPYDNLNSPAAGEAELGAGLSPGVAVSLNNPEGGATDPCDAVVTSLLAGNVTVLT